MTQSIDVEEIFKTITNRFSEISKQVESINKIIENIGLNFSNSIVNISDQIENLTNTLEDIMKVSDLKNVKQSIHKIIETFRVELDPIKIQKIISGLTQTVKRIKEQSKSQVIEG